MSYTVTIEPTGDTVEVEEGQTVLDACLRQGIWLPHACGHGLCGTCKSDLIEGEVDHGDASGFALMDFEREEGKVLTCTCKPLSELVIEADIDEDPDARSIPVRDFETSVERVEELTHDIKGVWLRVQGEPMDFQAGQYINLHIPGLETPRPFSLANPPSQGDLIELHVRLVEGGKGTTWIHQEMQPGDRLKVSGPYGRFFVRKSEDSPMIFMAGGTGLSSPKSMILDLLEEQCQLPITLFHGVRARRDLYDHSLFSELSGRHPNLSYIPVLSEPQEGDEWQGETGFVHEAAQRHFDKFFGGNSAYLCGPPVMIEACIGALMQGRLFERDIFTERFLTSSDDSSAIRSPLFKHL